ncbi:MAG: Asp-tRNA(Asn)/Glu-tRNA(Gln) amidotransferase subunit GatC [Oscillospiraceae bacterium]|nr:Asp-tRNA(Asn)/Glu-tRNA(Gln) amidotransferase subunit GatC [Oscillospiraceae bacterium]
MQIDIKRIAKLSRLRIEESEAENYENEMKNIISMVERMPEISDELTIDADNVMTLRPDELADVRISRDVMLSNAPKVVAGCVVVPKTVE